MQEDKKVIEEIKGATKDLQELNKKLDLNDRAEKFLEENEERVFNKFCEIYPEKIHSDYLMEDMYYEDIIEFVEEYFEEEI